MGLLLAMVAGLQIDCGRLSVYRPGDGWNSGELACGGRFSGGQSHVAYRGWRSVGCGRHVLVVTGRGIALSTVQDAGPFGVVRGRAWKPWPRRRPPAGWRWRCVTDLSWGLWKKLGRPTPLSRACLLFVPRWLDLLLRPAAGESGLFLDVGA